MTTPNNNQPSNEDDDVQWRISMYKRSETARKDLTLACHRYATAIGEPHKAASIEEDALQRCTMSMQTSGISLWVFIEMTARTIHRMADKEEDKQ